MTAPRLTSADVDHLRKEWEAINHEPPCIVPECMAGGCDCHSSAVVMTSAGYVEIWHDGAVIGFGSTLYHFGREA